MTTSQLIEEHWENPWPTRAAALETARTVAEQARRVYGDQLAGVWLYGSRARDDWRADSDLDILIVKTSEDADPQDLLADEVQRLLASHLPLAESMGLSLMVGYVDQMSSWDTMFYRSIREYALLIDGDIGFRPGPHQPSATAAMTHLDETLLLLEDAEQYLAFAEDNQQGGMYPVAVSLSYYAALHAAKAVLAYHRDAAKTHKGTHALFRLHAVRRSDFPNEVAGLLAQLAEERGGADYHGPTRRALTETDAANSISKAKTFVSEVQAWFDRHHKSDLAQR